MLSDQSLLSFPVTAKTTFTLVASLSLSQLWSHCYRLLNCCSATIAMPANDCGVIRDFSSDQPFPYRDAQVQAFRKGGFVDGDDACIRHSPSPLKHPPFDNLGSALVTVTDYIAKVQPFLNACRLRPYTKIVKNSILLMWATARVMIPPLRIGESVRKSLVEATIRSRSLATRNSTFCLSGIRKSASALGTCHQFFFCYRTIPSFSSRRLPIETNTGLSTLWIFFGFDATTDIIVISNAEWG